VVDRYSSTCRAGVVTESVSGSSREALERMAVPTCTQHEDPGARALCKPITYAFAPIGLERREIFDAVGLFSHRMPFTRSVSRADIGVQAVRRYGSRRIGYRAMYVQIGNLVVCTTRHRLFVCLIQSGYSRLPYEPSLESDLTYKRNSLPSLMNESNPSL
jgi:hypothetical protein